MDGKMKEKIDEKMLNEIPEEDIKSFETKVERVMQILQDMNSPDTNQQEKGLKKADDFLGADYHLDDVDDETFIVKVRDNRTIINKTNDNDNKSDPKQMDKFTFMQQLEDDANKRSEVQREREKIAQNFRNLGNEAFRKQNYEKSINMYTKAIDHIKDSPILYNNRALCYIKLNLQKRAIIDCDYVINKLDDKNLRAWLYRATAYYQLQDEKNYLRSVKWAKKHNSKELEYIEIFLGKLKIEQI